MLKAVRKDSGNVFSSTAKIYHHAKVPHRSHFIIDLENDILTSCIKSSDWNGMKGQSIINKTMQMLVKNNLTDLFLQLYLVTGKSKQKASRWPLENSQIKRNCN